jgi:hypothetical protein
VSESDESESKTEIAAVGTVEIRAADDVGNEEQDADETEQEAEEHTGSEIADSEERNAAETDEDESAEVTGNEPIEQQKVPADEQMEIHPDESWLYREILDVWEEREWRTGTTELNLANDDSFEEHRWLEFSLRPTEKESFEERRWREEVAAHDKDRKELELKLPSSEADEKKRKSTRNTLDAESAEDSFLECETVDNKELAMLLNVDVEAQKAAFMELQSKKTRGD